MNFLFLCGPQPFVQGLAKIAIHCVPMLVDDMVNMDQ